MVDGVLQISTEGLIVLPSGKWYWETDCNNCRT